MKPARILIVDDESQSRELLEVMLTHEGFLLAEAASGQEALDLVAQQAPDLILLDVMMPDMNGYQVAARIKETRTTQNIPVIMVSALADRNSRLHALSAGAAEFLTKPVDRLELSIRIKNLLRLTACDDRDGHHSQMPRQAAAADETDCIESQRMEVLGQLAGGIAHDFNNILSVIMGYSEMLASALAPDSLLHSHAEQIQHASQRAVSLTQQLLVYSRRQVVQAVVIDLNNVLEDSTELLLRLIDENIEMTIVPGKQIGHVKADSGHIGQVLLNLAINARDAMPDGGKLTITIDNGALDNNDVSYVILTVADTGTGMTDEVKARLFEPFFTTKPRGKGTGLGLATCQTIVQQSGGHIVVRSEIGEGTTFRIYFPTVDLPLEIVPAPIQMGQVSRGTETVLVVEDEPSVRNLACAVLASYGYVVLSASNGQDALQVARRHGGSTIRLVVTDVIMPLMGGKAMAACLKETYPDLKILFTSGYMDDAITPNSELDPETTFLLKPYTPGILADKVRALLDR